MTVMLTSSRLQWPWAMRSRRRPGQATTMSTPARRALTCGFWLTPPKIVVTVRSRAAASGVMVSAIWRASSRVGARTRPMGWLARAQSSSARRWTRGREKARVLPLPVRPRPRTSRPARVSRRVADWMGKGVVNPRAARSATRSGSTPRLTKFGAGAFRPAEEAEEAEAEEAGALGRLRVAGTRGPVWIGAAPRRWAGAALRGAGIGARRRRAPSRGLGRSGAGAPAWPRHAAGPAAILSGWGPPRHDPRRPAANDACDPRRARDDGGANAHGGISRSPSNVEGDALEGLEALEEGIGPLGWVER